MTRLFAVLLASLAAAACVAVRTDVAVTHTLPATASAKTVAIVPYTDNLAAAPEYQANAQKLAAQLSSKGYNVVPAQGAQAPDYLAFFLYRIDNGTTADTPLSRPHPPTGSLFAYGYRTEPAPGARPIYRRMVRLEILDRTRYRPSEPASFLDARVYSASVTSQGACPMMAPVIDPMLTALFADFPGQSGGIRSIDVSAGSTCGLNRFG